MKNLKATLSLMCMVFSVCCFIEMFNVQNNETEMFVLMASYNVCAILAYLFLRWAK